MDPVVGVRQPALAHAALGAIGCWFPLPVQCSQPAKRPGPAGFENVRLRGREIRSRLPVAHGSRFAHMATKAMPKPTHQPPMKTR